MTWRKTRWAIQAIIPDVMGITLGVMLAAVVFEFVAGWKLIVPIGIAASVVVYGALVFEFGFRRGWW